MTLTNDGILCYNIILRIKQSVVEVFVESIAVFCIMLIAYAGMFRMLVRDSGDPTAERQTLGIIGAISLVLGVWFGQFQAYIMWYCTAMTLAILTVLVGTYLFEKLNATEQQNVQFEEPKVGLSSEN